MTETLEEMIARLSKSKGACPCGARSGEPCTRPTGAARLPHVGRGDLPPDMVIDPAVGQDYTGGAFTEAMQASAPAPCCPQMAAPGRPIDLLCDCDAGRGPAFKVKHGGLCKHLAHLREDHAATTPSAFLLAVQSAGIPATTLTDKTPKLADDVAALRTSLGDAYAAMPTLIGPALSILDRLAGAVPQRATDGGEPAWQHACGSVFAGPEQRPDECPRGDDGPWRPLYTLGGE